MVTRKRWLALVTTLAVALSALAGIEGQVKAETPENGKARPIANVSLVMVEEPGCPHCARWHREVGPAYAASAEGRFAVLQRVTMGSPEAVRLGGVRYSPTFIVLRDRQEVGRIVGYPGADFFWPMLEELLRKAGYRPAGAGAGTMPKS